MKLLQSAIARLNKKKNGKSVLFRIQKFHKKCNYFKNRLNKVRDKMVTSGFGVEDFTSQPDLRAAVLQKTPLYDGMEQFKL